MLLLATDVSPVRRREEARGDEQDGDAEDRAQLLRESERVRDGGERGGVAPPLHARQDSREDVQTAQRVPRALQTGGKTNLSEDINMDGGLKDESRVINLED